MIGPRWTATFDGHYSVDYTFHAFTKSGAKRKAKRYMRKHGYSHLRLRRCT
jgi:hypothetical protein